MRASVGLILTFLMLVFPLREGLSQQAPAKRFVSEEAKKEFFQSLQGGELIFTGKIRAITLSAVAGISNPPVRITRITFDEIQMLKGEKPYENTFIYPKSPETLNYSRGMRVVVVLRQASATNGLKISGIAEENSENLALAERAIASAPRGKAGASRS